MAVNQPSPSTSIFTKTPFPTHFWKFQLHLKKIKTKAATLSRPLYGLLSLLPKPNASFTSNLPLQPATTAHLSPGLPPTQSLWREAACKHLQIPSLFSYPSMNYFADALNKPSTSTAVYNARQTCFTTPGYLLPFIIHFFVLKWKHFVLFQVSSGVNRPVFIRALHY